ncbi:PREDICTED: uncharacterized protein LOC104588635 [Nelumbo nucifera]|uniref:Uncharacterized protein LOC104588635 n=1 Tax=Nelumbo nucifera TaxID=4432 RepID=A0A1U7Z2S2_NELNU|nr:PREDICTED: uncharacterized protein LOC104588635 [Nelumbo nucifera]
MATVFQQWELDPLFSAAEVVQDSADRMESIFRMLLHEESLVHGESSDPKLLNSIEYHRRDLLTALGTTKWQLEDFERAVNLSDLPDNSRARADVVSRHKQFVRAIREQIIHVEKSLAESPMEHSKKNTQWVNLNEQDRDGLTLFLSGGSTMDRHTHYGSDNSSIMRRFLDPTSASRYDCKTDEIVELKTEEVEDSKMNGIIHEDPDLGSFKENNNFRKVGSHSAIRIWDWEDAIPSAKNFFCKNKLRGSRNGLNALGSMGNFWSSCRTKMDRSFMKRQKDGEVGREFDKRPSSYLDISETGQGRHTRVGLVNGFRSSGRLYSEVLRNAMQSCSCFGNCRGRFQRFQYSKIAQLSRRLIPVIFVTLVVLGILAFQAA